MLKKRTDISAPLCFVIAAGLFALRLFFVSRQTLHLAINAAPLDDELMFALAQNISAGKWLGDYGWLTLSKGSFYALWLAFLNALSIPVLVGAQGLWGLAAAAGAGAFAPALKKRWKGLALYAFLLYSPAACALFTLRVYRDSIYPALCLFVFAGIAGAALRRRGSIPGQLPWLCMAGVFLGAQWLTREDGPWLLPFVVVGLAVTAWDILGSHSLKNKPLRLCALALPFALAAACLCLWAGVNKAHYGRFILSDFSTGEYAAAVGAMQRVDIPAESWNEKVSVPANTREQLYDLVPALAPLAPWLEENDSLRIGFADPDLGDYSTGAFYWALRKAANIEGLYITPEKARAYWQGVAQAINALCEDGTLAAGGRDNSVTAPIRLSYVPAVLKEGLYSFGYAALFADCRPYYTQISPEPYPEEVARWEAYLHQSATPAAVEGGSEPYIGLSLGVLEALRNVYALALPLLLAAALFLQLRRGLELLGKRRGKTMLLGRKTRGDGVLWLTLAGLLLMALLRCAMVAFVQVSSFTIGTYVMYISTVHPLLLLYAGVGVLTELPEKEDKRVRIHSV